MYLLMCNLEACLCNPVYLPSSVFPLCVCLPFLFTKAALYVLCVSNSNISYSCVSQSCIAVTQKHIKNTSVGHAVTLGDIFLHYSEHTHTHWSLSGALLQIYISAPNVD